MTAARIVIGLSGASGAIYGIRLLEVLRDYREVETHLVVTRPAEEVIRLETDYKVEQVKSWAAKNYDPENLAAAIASGSFLTSGMVVAPCSMKTAAALAAGFSDNLLSRAADVHLKEKRCLVLLPRETPLHQGHLLNLLHLAERGAVILPPLPAFYHRPASIKDIVDHTVGKVLDILGLEHGLFSRWGE